MKLVTWNASLSGDVRDFLTLEPDTPKELITALFDSVTSALVPFHTISYPTPADKIDARQSLLNLWDKCMRTFIWATETPAMHRNTENRALKLAVAIMESSCFELSSKKLRTLMDMDVSRQYLLHLSRAYQLACEKMKLRMETFGESLSFCTHVLAVAFFRLDFLHKPLLQAATAYECKQLKKWKASTEASAEAHTELSPPASLKRAGDLLSRSQSTSQFETTTSKRGWIPQLLGRVKSWGETKGPLEGNDEQGDDEPNDIIAAAVEDFNNEDNPICPSLSLSEWRQCAVGLSTEVDGEAMKRLRVKFLETNNTFFLQFLGEVLTHGHRFHVRAWIWSGYADLLHNFLSRAIDNLLRQPSTQTGGYSPKRLNDPFLRACQLFLRNRDVLGLLVEVVLRTTRLSDRQAIVQNYSVIGLWFSQCCSLNTEQSVLYYRFLPKKTLPYELILQSLSLCLAEANHVILLHTLIFLYEHINEFPNAARSQLCQRLLLHPTYFVPLIGHWSMYVRKAFLCILAYKLSRTTTVDQRLRVKESLKKNAQESKSGSNSGKGEMDKTKTKIKSLFRGLKDSLKGSDGDIVVDEVLEKTANFRIAQAFDADMKPSSTNRIFWMLRMSEETIQTDIFLLSLSSYLYERTAHRYRILTASPALPTPLSLAPSCSSSSSIPPLSPSASSSVLTSTTTITPITTTVATTITTTATITTTTTAASSSSHFSFISTSASAPSPPPKKPSLATKESPNPTRRLSALPASLPTVNPLGEWLGGQDIDALTISTAEKLPSTHDKTLRQQWKPSDLSIFSQITKEQQTYLGLGLTEFWSYLQDAFAQQKTHAKLNGVVYPEEVNVLPPKGDEVVSTEGVDHAKDKKRREHPVGQKKVAAAVAVFRRLAGSKVEESPISVMREATEREKEEERVIFNRQQCMGQETGRLFKRDAPRMETRVMSCVHCGHYFQFVELHKCPIFFPNSPLEEKSVSGDVSPSCLSNSHSPSSSGSYLALWSETALEADGVFYSDPDSAPSPSVSQSRVSPSRSSSSPAKGGSSHLSSPVGDDLEPTSSPPASSSPPSAFSHVLSSVYSALPRRRLN